MSRDPDLPPRLERLAQPPPTVLAQVHQPRRAQLHRGHSRSRCDRPASTRRDRHTLAVRRSMRRPLVSQRCRSSWPCRTDRRRDEPCSRTPPRWRSPVGFHREPGAGHEASAPSAHPTLQPASRLWATSSTRSFARRTRRGLFDDDTSALRRPGQEVDCSSRLDQRLFGSFLQTSESCCAAGVVSPA